MKNFNKAIITIAIAASFSANATVQRISTDKFHTLYIDKITKEVAVMGGSTIFNEAGNFVETNQNTPVPYGVGNAVSVVASAFRSYVLKYDGTVWASGREFGKTPIQLPVEGIEDVAASGNSVLFLKNGIVYEYDITSSTLNETSLPHNISEISADIYHCLAKTSDGLVYTWGHDTQGQLGNGDFGDEIVPVLIENIPAINHISTSRGNTVLTDINGEIWTIGDGKAGMTGNGTEIDELVPYQMFIENPEQVEKAYAGFTQTMVLYKDGHVEMIGWHNFIGNDVNGTRLYNTDYELVNIPELSDIAELDATGDHKMFIRKDGKIIGWGAGGNGQLGNGKNIETHYPEFVTDLTFPTDYNVEYKEQVQQCETPEPEYIYIETEVEVIKEVIKYVEVIKYEYIEIEVASTDHDNGHGNDEDGIDESNPGKNGNKSNK